MEDNLEPTNGPDELDDELQNEPVNELDDARKSSIAEHLDDIFDDERDDLQGGLPDDDYDAAAAPPVLATAQ